MQSIYFIEANAYRTSKVLHVKMKTLNIVT